ncbi:MAG: CoB--CoM heterodisulfide reductase iron-sulfur subunit A family protein [Acidobacteriota bacterium]
MNDTATKHPEGEDLLVIGGGIAGMTAAIEAAEAGCRVVLVEKSPSLGGRVAAVNQYFPKLCPPACGLEINYKRIKNNPAIQVLTMAEVENVTGEPGDYTVSVRIAPRYVTEACTLCGDCTDACKVEIPDPFNFGLSKTKAAGMVHKGAFPAQYVIHREACPDNCRSCEAACQYGAVHLAQQVERRTFHVAAVVAATGWAPYDAAKLDNLGYGKTPDVVTNVIMERLASPDGPTGGKILRPSDGKAPSRVAFVQCAGSRDENHLPYCSAVCCPASLKQATYVREQHPDAEVTIFYIDIRTLGRLEDFYSKVAKDEKIRLVKGKVAKVSGDAGTGGVTVEVEDVMGGRKLTETFDLVVLATGIVPQTDGLPEGFVLDEFNFIAQPAGRTGLYAAGCARRPEEVSATVQDGTGSALRAFQCVVRSAHHG